MANVLRQAWGAAHGEDVEIVLTGTDNTDPTGFALTFTVSAGPGNDALVTVSTPDITVSGTGPYLITVPLTRAQTGTTLTADEYAADLWRTDSGSNQRLASGKLKLDDPVRAPA